MRYGRNFRSRKKANPIPDPTPANEGSDFDEPVALNFKDVEQERIKMEKTIKSAIFISKKKGKEKSKAKDGSKKSVTFSLPTESNDKVLQSSDEEENAEEFDVTDAGCEQENRNDDDSDINLDEFLKAPKVKKAKKSTHIADVANEFDLSDTFDFRKYLPKSILNEYGKEVDVDSDSDEELANAFIEGQCKEESDDDDDEKPKSKKLKKDKKKKTQEARSISVSSHPGNEIKRRRRGGRRFHKKYLTMPRIIILSRQNTASMIRQRTEAFIKERLFGASPKMRGPRRYSGEEEIARVRLQSRARRL
ncbi:unnamed protein product [Hymenolepis diminuta]|uniref:Nucleolar protein n=1 Tax=Hymenolepis diminuta TaxID=6216 RepID=A0A0R3SPB4_HYMDI|nr:unnamed protein product [Hymenolepis diminuta]VUZ54528.1 unnamed protein product [Hymenolepis diminuta]